MASTSQVADSAPIHSEANAQEVLMAVATCSVLLHRIRNCQELNSYGTVDVCFPLFTSSYKLIVLIYLSFWIHSDIKTYIVDSLRFLYVQHGSYLITKRFKARKSRHIASCTAEATVLLRSRTLDPSVYMHVSFPLASDRFVPLAPPAPPSLTSRRFVSMSFSVFGNLS